MNFEYDKLKSSISHLHASKPRLNYKITSIVPSKKKNPTQKLVTSFRQSIQTHKLQSNSKYKTSKNSRKHFHYITHPHKSC